MDVEKLFKEKAGVIDGKLEEAFPKDGIPNLNDAVWYHMGTGGKRVRPVLAILTCEALGGKEKKILPFAAACEVLHNWFLIHDDIQDGDVVRRDKPAVWVKYGLGHGVNVGDYMAHKVFELILDSDLDEKTIFKLMRLVIATCLKTAEGQAMDMNLRGNDNPTEQNYLDMIEGKTAHYLTLPILGGIVVAGSDEQLLEKILEYGKYVGLVFQITDDVLDLTAGKGRGEIGRDIKEGKKSLLVVHCLSKCDDDEKKRLLDILNKKPDNTDDEEVKWVKELFEKYGSIEYAKSKAEDYSRKSKEVIKDIKPELKEILEFFSDYLLKRKK